jgi:hypothetical protein
MMRKVNLVSDMLKLYGEYSPNEWDIIIRWAEESGKIPKI